MDNVLVKVQIDLREWLKRRSANLETEQDERKASALAALDTFALHLMTKSSAESAGDLLRFRNERYLYHRRALAEERAIRGH